MDMTIFSREEVEGKLAASEARMDARLAQFEMMLKTGFADIRREMAELRAEMHKNTADIIKWVVTTILGVGVAMVVVLTFVINNAMNKPAAPQQPLVIVVPAAGAATAAPPTSGAPAR